MRMERRFCRMNTKTKILRISVESPNNHLNFKSYLSWNRKNKSTENLPFRSNDLDRLKCDVWKRVSVFPRNSLLFNENENRFVNPMDKYGSDCVTPFIYYTMCMIEVMLFVCRYYFTIQPRVWRLIIGRSLLTTRYRYAFFPFSANFSIISCVFIFAIMLFLRRF